MCEKFVYDRLKDYGYLSTDISDCLNKISKKTNFTPNEVCQLIKKELENIETSCIDKFSNSKPLKDYQKKVVDFMKTHRGIITSFDVGMGKTLTAIATAECLRKQAKFFGKKLDILVISNPTLQSNFKDEMKNVGVKKKKNYKFYPIQTFINKVKKKELDCSNKFVIIDEAHDLRKDYRQEFGIGIKKKGKNYNYISNAETMIRCVSNSWKVLLLTATPAFNKPYDILNLVAMVKGNKVPLRESRYNDALNDKFENIFGCLFAFKKIEDIENYPTRIDKFYWIVMSSKYLERYEEVEKKYFRKNFKKDDEEDEERKSTFMIDLRRAIVGNVKSKKKENDEKLKKKIEELNKINNPKIIYAIKIIKESLLKDESVVLYSEFIGSGIDIIKKILEKDGINYVQIIGKISFEEREKAIKKFNNGKVKVILMSRAGEQGINLKGTRHIILLEKGWVKAKEDQVIGRGKRFKSHIHLPEKDRNITIHHLVLIKPLDKAYINDDPPTKYKESVDLYLHKYSLKKDKDVQEILSRLAKVDIFNKNCE